MMLSDICLTYVCLSVAYIGPKTRTERPIGRLKLAQRLPTSLVTRTPLSRSKGQRSRSQWAGHIVAAPAQLVMPPPHRAEALSDAFV